MPTRRPTRARPAHATAMLLTAVFATAALTLTLPGCSSPAPRTVADAPVTIPADWAGRPGRAAPVPDDWWRAFGGAPLAGFLDAALAANPDLHATAARLTAASARAAITGADRLPQASARFSRNRAKNIFIGLPIPGSGTVATRSSDYDLALDFSWEVDLWGRLAASEDAALAEVGAAAADLAGARLSLTGRVVKGWVGLAEAQHQRDLARQNLRSWSESHALIERRYRSGLRPPLDLHLIAASEAAAAARLADRERALAEARRTLQVLMGRYPDAALPGGDGPLPVLTDLAPPGLPADLLARRPDLAAAELRLAGAESRIEGARAAFYPALALTGSAGTTSTAMHDLLDGNFSVWSLFGQVVQPLFQGGRLRAGVELADAEATESLAQFTGALLDAFAEVEVALEAERRLAEREAALAAAARESGAARDLAARLYSGGSGDVLVMFETERGAQDAEIALLAVRRARLDARVDLYLALGGGFDRASSGPTILAALDADAPRAVTGESRP